MVLLLPFGSMKIKLTLIFRSYKLNLLEFEEEPYYNNWSNACLIQLN